MRLSILRRKLKEINRDQFKQYIILLILFLILLLPNLFTLFYSPDLQGNLVMSVAYIALSFSVLLLPLSFLKVRTFFWIGSVFVLFSAIEIGSIKNLGTPVSEGFMEAVLTTNFLEIREQLSANIGILVFTGVLVICYFLLLQKLTIVFIPLYYKYFIVGFFVILNAILVYKMYVIHRDTDTIAAKLEGVGNSTLMKYKKIYPVDLMLNTKNAISNNRKNKQLIDKLVSFTFQAKQYKGENDREIHVLVIGETARYANFHINGYTRQTTPKLETLENFISFSNVYSGATLTGLSVPQIITRAHPENLDLQFKEKTLLDAFQEAGFYTAWVGNQNVQYPLVKRFEQVADYCYFNKSEIDANSPYDTDIIPHIQTILSDKSKKKFIMIHTLGSHFRYSKRYPQNFERFQPAISKNGYEGFQINNKEQFVNAYDNSILFTDFFLYSLIKELKQTNTISTLTYISDHGENLFDDEKKLILHGTEAPSQFEYHVPLFFWYSKEYQDKNSQKINYLNENKYKKVSSTAVFYTLLDVANIQYHNSEKEIHKSLSHYNYQEPSERKLINVSKKILTIE